MEPVHISAAIAVSRLQRCRWSGIDVVFSEPEVADRLAGDVPSLGEVFGCGNPVVDLRHLHTFEKRVKDNSKPLQRE